MYKRTQKIPGTFKRRGFLLFITHYGSWKLFTENLARAFFRRSKVEALHSALLRSHVTRKRNKSKKSVTFFLLIGTINLPAAYRRQNFSTHFKGVLTISTIHYYFNIVADYGSLTDSWLLTADNSFYGGFLMNVTPLGDRIVVKPAVEELKSKGGIIIPDSAKEKPSKGDVIAIGPGKVDDTGKRIPMELKAGDQVLFGKYSGTEYELDGEKYLIMRENEVYATIN